MSPARARTRNAQSVGDRANHEATTPPQMDWTKLGMKKNLKKKSNYSTQGHVKGLLGSTFLNGERRSDP